MASIIGDLNIDGPYEQIWLCRHAALDWSFDFSFLVGWGIRRKIENIGGLQYQMFVAAVC